MSVELVADAEQILTLLGFTRTRCGDITAMSLLDISPPPVLVP
jgi:hypothetical protein